jgi:hypothetical protein
LKEFEDVQKHWQFHQVGHGKWRKKKEKVLPPASKFFDRS